MFFLIYLFIFDKALAADLKSKLEAARKAKLDAPKDVLKAETGVKKPTESRDDDVVVLTRTDKKGLIRPLDDRLYPSEPQKGRRKKKQKVFERLSKSSFILVYF